MKVLQLINNLGSGGAEKLVSQLSTYFCEQSVETDVFLLTDHNNVYEENLKSSNVRVFVSKYHNLYDIRNIFEIKKQIDRYHYDVVHIHLFPSLYWAALAKNFLKNKLVKYVFTEHNTHNRRRKKIYYWIEKFIYSKYDRIISISEQTQENLIQSLKPALNEQEKFRVIMNGIDVQNIQEAQAYRKCDIDKRFSENTFLIAMVARFSEQKDHATLLRAMTILPNDCHLLLIGEGPLMEKNKCLVQELQLEERVHFLGFRKDVYRILKTVDVSVLSSYWEGFGLVSAESMACGTPVFVSAVEGLMQVVNHDALQFEQGNSKLLADKLLHYFQSESFRQEMKSYSIGRAKCFDIHRMYEQYLDVYDKITS